MLLLDKGAQRVQKGELSLIEPPEPTKTWKPVSHSRVLDMVTDSLGNMGFRIKSMDLAVAQEGQQFFGTLDIEHSVAEGVNLAVGVRNSTDKSLSAALCAGERVMVCSNLAFGGEVQIARKHTVNVERDFHVRTVEAVLSLRQYAEASQERIEGMQGRILNRFEADSLMLRAYEKKVVGARLLPKLIQEWREPSYEAFEKRTAWSLYNCFTHVLKGRQRTQPINAASETMRFQKLLCS